MSWIRRLTVLTMLLGGMVALTAAPHSAKESEATGKWKLIVVGLARDHAAAPVPTPTVGSAERVVTIQIDLVANEGAIVEGGAVPVVILAAVSGPLPAQSGPAETYIGTISVKPHLQVDSASCSWTREFTDDDLRVQISQPAGSVLSVLAGVTFNPSWHYNVVCPGGVKVRYPTTSEVSLAGYLALIFPGQAGVTGAVIPTPVYSGSPDCVRRYGELTGATQFGTGKIRVYVHEPGCLLPLVE